MNDDSSAPDEPPVPYSSGALSRRVVSRPAIPSASAPVERVDDDTLVDSTAPDDRWSDSSALSPAAVGTTAEQRVEPLVQRYYLKLTTPRVTYVMIIANLAMFVLMIWVGWSRFGILNGYESVDVLVLLGAKVNELIVRGQVWRLFTAMFLHVGLLHLLFNVYAIYAIGPLVEGYYGHLRFALIYLIGGLFGSLASFAFSPSISAGASGAVFAIAASAAVYFFRYRENFGARGRAILQNMLLVLGANLVFGMVAQGIDNWGHFGGMVGGLIMGWVLLPHYTVPLPQGRPEAPVAVMANRAPLRVALGTGGALAILWLGQMAATSHYLCASWFGC